MHSNLSVYPSLIHTTMYIEIVNNILQHSAESSTQYSVMTRMGKSLKKSDCMYMYNRRPLLCTRNHHNIVNQLHSHFLKIQRICIIISKKENSAFSRG